MNIIFFTTFLITAIVALLDQKLINVLDEKNSLKDKYSHDLGNILHSISMTYDLFTIQESSKEPSEELDQLMRNKIREASDLVKDIRKL